MLLDKAIFLKLCKIMAKLETHIFIRCDQQLFRSKKPLEFGTYFQILDFQMLWCSEVFLVAYTNLNLEIFTETRPHKHVRCMLLKTSLRFNDEPFMFWSKNHFCVKIWLIVTVVWRLLAQLAKIRKIWHCQSHSRPLSK
jgi:hypothetical protein